MLSLHCSSRDAGDRSRDRELQAKARAQMSSMLAEPEESFMPVFDAPVRVISSPSFSSLPKRKIIIIVVFPNCSFGRLQVTGRTR